MSIVSLTFCIYKSNSFASLQKKGVVFLFGHLFAFYITLLLDGSRPSTHSHTVQAFYDCILPIELYTVNHWKFTRFHTAMSLEDEVPMSTHWPVSLHKHVAEQFMLALFMQFLKCGHVPYKFFFWMTKSVGNKRQAYLHRRWDSSPSWLVS